VMAQYERDWGVLSRSVVEVRELVESGDGIIAEITVKATISGRSFALDAVVAHRAREPETEDDDRGEATPGPREACCGCARPAPTQGTGT
jgi:hypothetical protein